MKNLKKVLAVIVFSYVFILGVNIAANWNYYAAGNDWHYSIYLNLGMTTVAWVFFGGMYYLVFRKMNWLNRPRFKIILMAFIYGALGALLVVLVLKSMVWFFGSHEFSASSYIDSAISSALFSMVIGLIITAQQSLVSLKKSIEDNEHLKQEMIRGQYETLKNQVNPHFLFNSLNTLTVMIPREPQLAVSFVEQMSKVFRYSLEHTDENTVNLQTEVNIVKAYLFLNMQRFDNKLATHIDISPEVLQNKIIAQSLLMLVENAIKHNEISNEHPLAISIYNEDEYLVVQNNLQPKTGIASSTKVGLENIKKRYQLVSEYPVMIDNTNNMFTVKIPMLK